MSKVLRKKAALQGQKAAEAAEEASVSGLSVSGMENTAILSGRISAPANALLYIGGRLVQHEDGMFSTEIPLVNDKTDFAVKIILNGKTVFEKSYLL